MDILVSDISALQYWRTVGVGFLCDGKARRVATTCARNTLKHGDRPVLSGGRRRPGGCKLPLRVLVSDVCARTEAEDIASRLWGGDLPGASFVDAGEGFLVSTPEFCFLQMASQLTLVQLIQLGFELCGTYALVAADEPAVNRGASLTTASKLRAFLEKSPNAYARRKALRAVHYVVDGSASPMETVLSMLLCLPYGLGGYGIERPLLNHRIDIPQSAKKSASKSYCECDLFWPKANLAVEYDSDLYHTGEDKIARDAMRRTTLIASDIAVVTVTNMQLVSGELLNKVAQLIAKQTGKRLRYRDPEFTQKHYELRNELLESLSLQ